MMMSANEDKTLRFLQYVEDSGLRAYNGLITHKLDYVWNEKSRSSIQEKNDKKRKQEEAGKRTGEEVPAEVKHLRMASGTMPAPAERVSPQHPQLCSAGFAVRSQSLHSVGGGEEEGSPTSRKLPPPKPRRDPNTKLSISSDSVDFSSSPCRGGDPDRCDGMQGCSEDCRRVPPPKPKRNPNTQLSTSFDESYVRNATSRVSPPMPYSRDIKASSPPPLQPQSPQQDSDSEEPVYIEMSGSVCREPASRVEDEEPGEAVYEEMKYPLLDEYDSRWDLSSCRSQCATPCPSDIDSHNPLSRCSTPRGTLCDIPAPFPNLLTHRPPLLVFPPAPAQCSPNSDESPLTPLDVAKLPMLDNSSSYAKSPTSSSSLEPLSSASTSHIRRAERELTATPTLTVSGRSSAPPLPCALYRSSGNSHNYQRSHSACPSPVSMGRCLTPLSLMRTPAFDGPFSGPAMPRSASATPHGKGSPPQDQSSRLHGSMQNVSTGRSRTPTSPLDELTNLFTTGRNMLKKNSSGRKSKEPGESESKGRCHSSESKREHKERSHHKESKRDKERSSKSSHRRESKDPEANGTEAVPRRDSKDRGCSTAEPLSRHDSKDKGCSNGEPLLRRDSKDRGSSNGDLLPRRDSKDRGCGGPDLLPRQDSKDRGCSTAEPVSRHESKDRGCSTAEALPRRNSKDRTERMDRTDRNDRTNGPDILPRQDSKDLSRNGLERCDSRDRSFEVLSRHDTKDLGIVRNGLECRRNSKEGGRNGLDSRQGSNYASDCGRDGKEWNGNGTDHANRRDCKDRGVHTTDALTRPESKDSKGSYSTESPKAHDRDARSNRPGRSPVSPTMPVGNSEPRPVPKVGRSPSTPTAPSPLGTPQRQPLEAQQQVPPMPWAYGDATMLEMIERKQRLCREIRSRQRLPDRSPCKKETLPAAPNWKKANGAKKYGPPPYPTQTTVFWDTAI
ncbi:neuronal tyrosine-phosphorylated phosphoinositide-3-kinase adapter 2 [Astyanax mexicanus]|uniref:neuronal tyrosine-phosphorylated phosphoinositide-3-kinase adapter 2 n=1 Tax=Astyanax mexicanus TaxID=7994 RepID=UPI0020CAF509|nr:neuronal tyrosine-phosphorylated phosphoinositide-3-kinase adapter 2 [Astyanax mexicanus]